MNEVAACEPAAEPTPAPLKPVASAPIDALLHQAIDAYRAGTLPTFRLDLTTRQWNSLGRRLVALGCPRLVGTLTREDRLEGFCRACAEGSPVSFPAPPEPEPSASLPVEVLAVIDEQFPSDEWADVREAVIVTADRRVSPMRIAFDSALFREVKAQLKAVEVAMDAAGMFNLPRLYLMREVEQFRRDQDRLARSCRAAGLDDESRAAPELPAEITVRALGEQAYPSLKLQVHEAMRRYGWTLDGAGCWVEPKRRGLSLPPISGGSPEADHSLDAKGMVDTRTPISDDPLTTMEASSCSPTSAVRHAAARNKYSATATEATSPTLGNGSNARPVGASEQSPPSMPSGSPKGNTSRLIGSPEGLGCEPKPRGVGSGHRNSATSSTVESFDPHQEPAAMDRPSAPTCRWCNKAAAIDPEWGLCPSCYACLPKPDPEPEPVPRRRRPPMSAASQLAALGIAPVSGGAPEETVDERVDYLTDEQARDILKRIINDLIANGTVDGTLDILHENCLLTTNESRQMFFKSTHPWKARGS